MASFDVSSLFTNVSLTESVNLCCDLLFQYSDLILYNECRKFCKLLNFAVEDNHFFFNKQLYDEIDGVALGSPLGLSLANICKCALEQKFLDKCTSEFKLFFIVGILTILFVFFVVLIVSPLRTLYLHFYPHL